MKTTSPTPKPGRKIVIDLKSVPVNYKAATRLFCQRYLTAALRMYSWNVTKCAKALGISRRTLQLRMRQFDISQYGLDQSECSELVENFGKGQNSAKVETTQDVHELRKPLARSGENSEIT